MTEIGKIERPEVSDYRNRKKIYFVRNLYLPQNATDKYRDIFQQYWNEVEEHLSRLEIAGKAEKIFCESVYLSGEEGMKVVSSMNVRLKEMVQKRIEAGGELLPLESREIFGIYIDWYNCLAVVRTSHVHDAIHRFLDETISDRFAHIKSVLQDNIADGEAALLIMRDEDRKFLQVPDDIELFLVTPPAYDDLMRFIRDSDSGKEYWRE